MIRMMMAAGAASVMSAVVLTSATSLAFFGVQAVLGSSLQNADRKDVQPPNNPLQK